MRPTDDTRLTPKGEACIVVDWAGTHAFDPAEAAFALVVDAEAVPARDHMETEADGALRTEFRFDIDDWAWDARKSLELCAKIGGEMLSIPFEYDPEKAYAQAIADARDMNDARAALREAMLDQFEELRAGAVPAGLEVAIQDRRFTLVGFLYRDGEIGLVYSVSGLRAESVEDAGYIALQNLTVDGVCAGDERAGLPSLANGVYENGAIFPLGRDPANLPDESLIAFDLVMDEWDVRRIAFKYRWADATFALPADAGEMASWAAEADERSAALYGSYGAVVYRDLSDLALSQEIDGVKMTLTSLAYVNGTNTMQLSLRLEGDVDRSRYVWTGAPTLTVDGRMAYQTEGETENAAFQRFDYNPLIGIAEFQKGESYVLTFPLYDAAATPHEVLFAQPVRTLTFEFSLDAD